MNLKFDREAAILQAGFGNRKTEYLKHFNLVRQAMEGSLAAIFASKDMLNASLESRIKQLCLTSGLVQQVELVQKLANFFHSTNRKLTISDQLLAAVSVYATSKAVGNKPDKRDFVDKSGGNNILFANNVDLFEERLATQLKNMKQNLNKTSKGMIKVAINQRNTKNKDEEIVYDSCEEYDDDQMDIEGSEVVEDSAEEPELTTDSKKGNVFAPTPSSSHIQHPKSSTKKRVSPRLAKTPNTAQRINSHPAASRELPSTPMNLDIEPTTKTSKPKTKKTKLQSHASYSKNYNVLNHQKLYTGINSMKPLQHHKETKKYMDYQKWKVDVLKRIVGKVDPLLVTEYSIKGILNVI
jgi:hypothetical protein